MEEMLAWIRTLKGVYAACLQETWKLGDTVEENTGCVLLNHGPEVKLCKRGSLGVAILLSPSAQKAWEKAGSLIKCANYLFQHLKAFGLLMHIGRGATASKTEAVFFPKPHQPSTSGDQTDFNVDGDGFISFSTEFKYLGSIIHNLLKSDSDIETRITKATAAFGALRKCFFDSKLVSLKDKGKVYSVLCLTILLYGSECWSLREDMFNRLRVFHNTCVRSMCRVTMRHVIRHHITPRASRRQRPRPLLQHEIAAMGWSRRSHEHQPTTTEATHLLGAQQTACRRPPNDLRQNGQQGSQLPRHHDRLCQMEGDRREESFMAKENTRMTGRVILPCAHTHTFFPHTAHTLITQ